MSRFEITVSEITGEEYTRHQVKYFRELKNFYHNLSYPGDSYERVDRETAAEYVDFIKSFKLVIMGQQIK